MTIDSRINTAVKTVVAECRPNVYDGSSLEYAVYNYTQIPAINADGRPHAMRYLIQVNVYLPHGKNPNQIKKTLANALLTAGFTYPTITNASDSNGQHYAFEFEGMDGEV